MIGITDKQEAKLQVSAWDVIKWFLIILIPLAVLLGGIASVFYYSAAGKERTKFETNELNVVTHQVAVIEREFKAIESDLVFLSRHHELKEMFTGDAALHKKSLAEEFLSFSNVRKIYDQIRFLDETGMEVIRVNFSDGRPYIVPEDQLQSKADRYYFQESITRDEGEIYVSQFDLNMEGGEIEQPLKPVIRYGTPVIDRHGNKRGILLFNYLGVNLLQSFKTTGADSLGQAMLLNSDGFWLNVARPEDEWGFMFKEREKRSYRAAFPQAWRQISATESGQFYTGDGFFTYRTVYTFLAARKAGVAPLVAPEGRQGDGMHFWKVVSYVPDHVLYAESRRIRDMIISLYVFGMVLFAIGTWFLARAGVIRKYVEVDHNRALAELAESEQYNRMLFEQSSIGLVLCRMNGELIDVNAAYARIIGRSIEETLQLTYWDITPETYAEDEQHQLESLKSTGRYDPYEKEYIHKDGHRVPVRLQGQLLEKDGEQMIWSSVEDVTKQKGSMQILQSLAGSSTSALGFEHFLQEALGNLTEFYGCKYAFVGQLLPDGRHVRTLAVRAGGESAENFEYDLKGTPCQDILDLKTELIPRNVSKLCAEDRMLVDMGVESYYGAPLRSADNKMIGLISVMDTEPMDIDSWSEPLLKVFASRISFEFERLNSEQALQESQKMLQLVLNSIPVSVFWKDRDLVYLGCNKHFAEGAGLESPEQIIGKSDFELGWSEQAGLYRLDDQQVMQSGVSKLNYEEPQTSPDGSHLWLRTSKIPLKDLDGNIFGVMGVYEDITVRRQNEDALKKLNVTLEARVEERTHELQLAKNRADAASQAKSNFLSNMSHEIRSPLAAIIGFSESLNTDDFSEQERKKITSTIIRSGKHLLQIVNDILDLSKIEAGQLEVELVNTSIFLLVGEIDSLLGMNVRDKGLAFKIAYHFPLPENIVTSSTCLKQILVNLCSNAIKFTNKGSIEIEVSCDSNLRQIQFVVTDSGIGMTAEEVSRAFDPFSQADTSTTRKYGGTGLGLSISSRLAKVLDGNLSCESKKGHGSRFTLTIANQDAGDVIAIDSLEEVGAHYDVQSEKVDIRPLTGSILLVEDSPDNQQLVSMYIRKTGAQLTIVDNGKQALKKAQAREFDLILMDMQMPVMDGLEAMRQLRASGYKRPIVSLTANAMLSDREKCVAAGADDYLVKPIELQRFYQILNRFLSEDKNITGSRKNNDLKKAMQDSPQYKAMVERFLAKLPQMLEEISSALAEENWDELQAKSHDLKGMGGALGYPVITEKAGLINTLVKQKNYGQLADASAELEKLCRSIIQEHEDQ